MAAARAGAGVTLLERYGYLGGWPPAAWSWCSTTCAASARSRWAVSRSRSSIACGASAPAWRRRWTTASATTPSSASAGCAMAFEELYARKKPKPIVYSAVFDPEGWKRVAGDGARGGRHAALPLLVLPGHRGGRRVRGDRVRRRRDGRPFGARGDRCHRRSATSSPARGRRTRMAPTS